MTLEEAITKCLIGEEHLDQAEYEQVGEWLEELNKVKQELNEVSQELEVYKKALEHIDTLLFDYCHYSQECVIRCEHKFNGCECLKEGMWAELALKKAREET